MACGLLPKLPRRAHGRGSEWMPQPIGEVLLLICCRCSNQETLDTLYSCIQKGAGAADVQATRDAQPSPAL
jgi:hypothetical protein